MERFRFVFVFLGLLLASPSAAQVSFDVGASSTTSSLLSDLLQDFNKVDPSLLTVISTGLDEEELADALTMGLVDVGFAEDTPGLRQTLNGMVFIKIATLRRHLAGIARSPQASGLADLVAIHPASPSPEVRRFLSLVCSRGAQATLRRHRADIALP